MMTKSLYDPEVEKRGIAIGLEQGIEQGVELKEEQIVLKFIGKGKSIEEISDLLDLDIEKIEAIIKKNTN